MSFAGFVIDICPDLYSMKKPPVIYYVKCCKNVLFRFSNWRVVIIILAFFNKNLQTSRGNNFSHDFYAKA